MSKIVTNTELRLTISLLKYFFWIFSFIIGPIFFIVAASNIIPEWVKTAIIYIVLPIVLYSSLRFFYKRKLIKMGLNHDPLNVRFASMGNSGKLIDENTKSSDIK
jgi:hypothetical protein